MQQELLPPSCNTVSDSKTLALDCEGNSPLKPSPEECSEFSVISAHQHWTGKIQENPVKEYWAELNPWSIFQSLKPSWTLSLPCVWRNGSILEVFKTESHNTFLLLERGPPRDMHDTGSPGTCSPPALCQKLTFFSEWEKWRSKGQGRKAQFKCLNFHLKHLHTTQN